MPEHQRRHFDAELAETDIDALPEVVHRWITLGFDAFEEFLLSTPFEGLEFGTRSYPDCVRARSHGATPARARTPRGGHTMTGQMESPVQTEEMRRFEELDAAFPDYRAEMIDGEVSLSTVVTSAHGNMVLTIASQLLAKWFVMAEVDTVFDGWHGKTLLRPGISVADSSYRGTQMKQFPADEVILVGEVVLESNPENDTDKKVKKYA
ncbi:hypothetical protein ACH4SK_26990 [Streptomyces inhibens]|uniref:hypothetical protein n=1 Tax=Streptomyces inhibens TaxID=2293571 RepID=UPI00378E9E3B